MIYRKMFIAYGNLKNVSVCCGENVIRLFKFGNTYFMYVETQCEDFNPDSILRDGLIPFPDGRVWFSMPSIFYASKPKSATHWKRKEEHTPYLRVNKIKENMVSSYVFEHHRMQEEDWPHPREKYDIIFIFGNLLAYYTEGLEEREIDTEPPKPSMTSRATPWEKWGELMEQKFEHIGDGQEFWLPAEPVDIIWEED